MRSAMTKEEVVQKSNAAANLFLESEFYKNSKQLMLYMPLGNETDTTLVMEAAFRDGKRVVLPVTDAQSGEITPAFALPDSKYSKGAFSVMEPMGTKIADMTKTDVILVPGIAFDQAGNRVGFGKGCYDKLLNQSSAVFIGFCYEFQICDIIPAEAHDIKMNYIITENRIISC